MDILNDNIMFGDEVKFLSSRRNSTIYVKEFCNYHKQRWRMESYLLNKLYERHRNEKTDQRQQNRAGEERRWSSAKLFWLFLNHSEG